jgi:hypothetical protein
LKMIIARKSLRIRLGKRRIILFYGKISQKQA